MFLLLHSFAVRRKEALQLHIQLIKPTIQLVLIIHTMSSHSLTSVVTVYFIVSSLLVIVSVHGYKIDVNTIPDLMASDHEDARMAQLKALYDAETMNAILDARPRRVGSMGWGPGGTPMSGATGMYIMCVERSRSMGSNAGQCSSFLAAKKWDRM